MSINPLCCWSTVLYCKSVFKSNHDEWSVDACMICTVNVQVPCTYHMHSAHLTSVISRVLCTYYAAKRCHTDFGSLASLSSLSWLTLNHYQAGAGKLKRAAIRRFRPSEIFGQILSYDWYLRTRGRCGSRTRSHGAKLNSYRPTLFNT